MARALEDAKLLERPVSEVMQARPSRSWTPTSRSIGW